MSATVTIGSLFSGYGGLDLAVQSVVGGRVAWVSDIEPGPSRILATHHPDIPNLGDVTSIDWRAVEPVDVICGGSPCQDLSMAGRRAVMRPGTRSGLWESMLAAITTIRPRLVVWENVRGALSADAFTLCNMESEQGHMGDQPARPALRALGRVLGDLANIGYDAEWCCLRASDIGAPHRRERVFVVAHRQGKPWCIRHGNGPASPHADGSGSDGSRRARDRIGEPQDSHRCTALTFLPTPTARDGKGANQRRDASCLTGALLLTSANRFGPYAQAITRWETIIGRAAPDPTESAPRGGRRLSPAFVEWLMGLPAGWVTGVEIPHTQQLRALGNGVVPQQAAQAITELITIAIQAEVAA